MAPRAPFKLTEEQRQVLSAVLSGKNVFFTGSAGTGKSFLLRQVIAALPPDSTAVTAATGIAACHISGVTLHSFAGVFMGGGIGTKEASLEQAVLRARQRSQLLRCRHLVIDEISMVHGQFFNTLERVARAVRNSNKPFGGIQIIVCGDFLQLPPVVRKGEQPATFCFETVAWRKSIEYNFELTRVMRQKDSRFVNILQKIRYGRCGAEVQAALKQTSTNHLDRRGIMATRICTHNDDVDFVNRTQLDKLPGSVQKFSALDTEASLSHLLNALCPSQLELKVGAQVMLTKNLDLSRGLANGSRGVVETFDSRGNLPSVPWYQALGLPKVKFVNGVEETIDMERWIINRPGFSSAVRRQLPLKLAWSVSVHKSQGMSLDCVEVSLSRVFESGQAYVALSRATALEGLRVVDFDPNRIQADPRVLEFYSGLRYTS
ncbi:PIF1 [Cordylochernes scorpioides]|uniref:ATP-dependent DNA helicase n=1 Tax=Cordylochernes scorpioides TaxID=51811 RepID=A0ABY6KEP9_9ARAC|nr:PIF1 [Cordylochernes scorpioides]